MATQEERDKARDLYLRDPFLGVEYYESVRGEGDPSPEEWEQDLLREIAAAGEKAVAAENDLRP